MTNPQFKTLGCKGELRILLADDLFQPFNLKIAKLVGHDWAAHLDQRHSGRTALQDRF